MNKKYVIYLHRNKINGKCYVGQTCQPLTVRWGNNGSGYRFQEYFYRAIQKYGWDNFEHIVLEDNLSSELADIREVFWGGYYHSIAPEGYNIILGNQHTSTTIRSPEELHEIRSNAAKKNWENEEYRKKVIQGRKEMWKNSSEECRNKMLSNLKQSEKNQGGKKVQCIETGIIYESTREAERLTGVCHNNISQVCNGKRKTAGKYHWKYI